MFLLYTINMSRDIITVFITSLTPVLELRGGMLLAWTLKISWPVAITICVLGSTILGIITYFLGEFFIYVLKRILPSYINRLEQKKDNLLSNYEKWGYIALTLFVGIPLPGTGAFTGALIAGILNLHPIKSILSIFTGNILAALILSLLFLAR